MKKITIIYSVLFFIFINIYAADKPGVNFLHITYQEALALSKKEHKMVFIHGFTDWCPHCKVMAETVYPDSELGNFFNTNFICLKIDMEKEGLELARKYQIGKYPGLLFLDENGDVVHRTTGEQKLPAMLQLGKDAIDPAKQYRTFENKFNSGAATTDEVRRFFIMKERSGISSQQDLNKFFLKIPVDSLTQIDNWHLIYDVLLDPTLPLMKTFIANKKAFEEKYSTDSVNMKLMQVYNSAMVKAAQNLDTVQFQKIKSYARNSGLDIAEKICAMADLNVLRLKGDYQGYAKDAIPFIDKYCKDDARKLSEVAKEVADHTTDKTLLTMTEKWASRSVKLMDLYKHNYNLAFIQQKLGMKSEAGKVAKHTLDLAQKTGVDTKPTLLLIDKIEELP